MPPPAAAGLASIPARAVLLLLLAALVAVGARVWLAALEAVRRAPFAPPPDPDPRLSHKSSCFSCESGAEPSWLGQPARCFSCQKELHRTRGAAAAHGT